MKPTATKLSSILQENENEILADWMKNQLEDTTRRDLISEASLRESSKEFLRLFSRAMQGGITRELESPEWQEVKRMLGEMSRTRALQGFTPTETANFIFSLKRCFFEKINSGPDRSEADADEDRWTISSILDKLGLYSTEIFQKSREEIIRRQQKDLLEMSTPVVKLWDGVLALPLIGTLDSARTQVIMETLLQAIVDTNSKLAILDITGVPTVDTQTAQHLIKTVTATRLMGAECIISGIRPQIAQTIVHLGIEINDVITKATMADAIKEALDRTGWALVRTHEDVGFQMGGKQ